MHALGLEFGSAARLSKRPGSVWNCLWGNALKRSPGIIRKSRVSYPSPGFLSSATWPLLPKKHYNGLNQTKINVNLAINISIFTPHNSPPVLKGHISGPIRHGITRGVPLLLILVIWDSYNCLGPISL